MPTAVEPSPTSAKGLEGVVANVCAERANVPGYGDGIMKKSGWFGLERVRWGKLFKLPNEKLDFFELHEEADIEHSDAGWATVAARTPSGSSWWPG